VLCLCCVCVAFAMLLFRNCDAFALRPFALHSRCDSTAFSYFRSAFILSLLNDSAAFALVLRYIHAAFIHAAFVLGVQCESIAFAPRFPTFLRFLRDWSGVYCAFSCIWFALRLGCILHVRAEFALAFAPRSYQSFSVFSSL
jgi:hypothetical protein